MQIKFSASIPPIQSAINISGDAGARVKIDVPECDLPEILKLVLFKGQEIKITAEVPGEVEQ